MEAVQPSEDANKHRFRGRISREGLISGHQTRYSGGRVLDQAFPLYEYEIA